MIAVDTNILVYAHRAESPFHAVASALVKSLTEGAATWAIPWPCLHEFVATATHPRVHVPPTPMQKACAQVEAWISSPSVALLTESASHWPTLRGLLTGAHIMGPKVHDARIAALCLQHGVSELWSADRDFNRFAGVKVRNPLVAIPTQ